jgi:uncharacterized RDD family membrane protein YckC
LESNQAEKICPYCQSPIDETEEATVCSQCMIPHHTECWLENGGCTTYGCLFAPPSTPVVSGNTAPRSITIAPAGLPGGVICPYCREETSNSLQKCEHCQGQLYAGFWNRLWAWIFDKILMLTVSYFILVIFIILGAITTGLAGENNAKDILLGVAAIVYGVLVLVASWLYFAITESSTWRASIGKILLGLAVTDYEGRKISFGRATARYFASIISYLLILLGFVAAGFTPRKQALHDVIAHTVVVRSVRQGNDGKDQNKIRRLVLGIIAGFFLGLFILLITFSVMFGIAKF